MSDLVDTVMTILMGNAEEMRYAEVDARFFAELDTLKLSEADYDTAIGAWLAVSDHVIEDRRPLTEAEAKLMHTIFERIVMRHGYGRVVKGNRS